GSQVTLNGSLSTTTDGVGYFSFRADALQTNASISNEGLPVKVEVSAPDHGTWSISEARYFSGAALRLYPKLPDAGDSPVVHTAAAFSDKTVEQQVTSGLSLDESPSADHISLDAAVGQVNVDAASAALVPPATIRVYRAATGQVEVVPFREYVKHVLPSEWIPTWKMSSLQAGAMSVKTYAWYWVARGGKQVALGADVKDNTEDQVYDPNVSYSTTDEAVDSTFDYAMTRGGTLFQAQYCAGSYGPDPTGDCPWGGPYMTQWGTAWHADQGRTWGWLVQFYYPDAVITPTPPGGGYEGPPVAPATPVTRQAAPTPVPANYEVGQGSDYPQVFREAFERNGGTAALGRPTGPVRWWLTYVSEHNVIAQPFSGADGKGNTWLVFDVLKVSNMGVNRAFLLSGALASTYATHEPPGPEWLGAPTSDPYSVDGGTATRQGFVRGSMRLSGDKIEAAPWPQDFLNWKAEYFAGHQVPSPQLAPPRDLPSYPASIQDVSSPSFAWTAEQQMPYALGAGKQDWSVQFTRQEETDGATYEFTVSADSGVRLWIDNMLAVNGWHWTTPQREHYTADLAPGTHQIRVQYYNLDASAQLGFEMKKPGTETPPAATSAPAASPQAQQPPQPQATAQLRVRVQWLGRGSLPNDSWVQPLTLQLSTPGSAAVVASYQGATDRDGVAQYSGLPAGIYNVHVKGPHSLQSARANISLSPGAPIELDMKMQVEGDVNGDNCVTVDDYSYVQSRLGTQRGTGGFAANADLNNDGSVSMSDVSLLRSGFDRCGDVSADTQFTIQSANAAPTLSQALSPWLRPDTLSRNLGLSLWTSADQVRVASTWT
ncbi:MAG: PA14 domain-containing protein, partial [Chloroflexota bacterium]|nr:PA14 domain-containing protein [Chloroflexota bacterium]